MGRNQAKVCIHLWMDQDMKVNGVMMIKTESEHSNSPMEMSIKDSL
jgi:aspartyl aminopeptidase